MPPAFKLRVLTRSKRKRSKNLRNIANGSLFQSSRHLDARERFFALLSAKRARLARILHLYKYTNASQLYSIILRCRVSALFAVGCVDSPHAAHLLNPDTYSRFLSLGGKFKIDQARSPSPGDRARSDGFAAQSHPDAASRTRVKLGHMMESNFVM